MSDNMSQSPLSARPPATDPLAYNAWAGSVSNIRFYLTKFANKLEVPSAGRTPLLWAISAGRVEATNIFLRAGADITKKTTDGNSALACAVWSGSVQMVQLMLQKGLDPSEKDLQGKTALDWARAGGQTYLVKILEAPTRAALEKRHAATAARNQAVLNKIARQKKKITMRP